MMTEKRLWELLTKQFNKEISAGELLELQQLLQEQEGGGVHGELLSDLHHMSLRPDAAEREAKANSLTKLMDSVRQEQPDQPEQWAFQPIRRRSVIRRMAFVFTPIAIAYACWFMIGSGRSGPAAEVFDKIATKAGSKTLITLPDSSTVTLNSSCQFAYNKDFGVKKREMQLTGEAYFDVRGNRDVPLIVHAGNVVIKVLGTVFNVRANAGDPFVEATLLKGAIEVSMQSDPERKILLRPGEKIVIHQDKGLPSATPAAARPPATPVITVSKVEKNPADSSYLETTWLKDKMVFRKQSFQDLAAQMERWYNVKIVLSDSSLRELLFTGSFEKESVEEAFQALQHSATFSYSITGNTITVTRQKGRPHY